MSLLDDIRFLRVRLESMRAALDTGLSGGPGLVDVQAKLRMVELCEGSARSAEPDEAALAEDVLRLLARPFSFEPDYDAGGGIPSPAASTARVRSTP